jgi:uncharacterized cupin superfamily protein
MTAPDDDHSPHAAIVRWARIEGAKAWQYPAHDEPMGLDAGYSSHFGFARIGIHHQRLPPGRRLSFPHAESAVDEFVHVLEGTPDVWLDGRLHRLHPGDAVGFPAGTGLAHTFLNNTGSEVRLLVVGDRGIKDAKIVYPLHPERRPMRTDWWDDAPERQMGDHDGLTDHRRDAVQRRGGTG